MALITTEIGVIVILNDVGIKMKKLMIVSLALLLLSGCGWMDRKIAAATGGATEACVSGVLYLQFTSGATVKYDTDGTVAVCPED